MAAFLLAAHRAGVKRGPLTSLISIASRPELEKGRKNRRRAKPRLPNLSPRAKQAFAGAPTKLCWAFFVSPGFLCANRRPLFSQILSAGFSDRIGAFFVFTVFLYANK
jgi:hypothetical protein